MDITPQDSTAQQPISDDQELAKALAGVMPDAPDAPAADTTTPSTDASAPAPADAAPAVNPMQFEETPVSSPVVAPISEPAPAALAPAPAPSGTGELDSIKKDALGELRPLIDKVDLPAEEKFDTYLMLIRSTDDSSLIAPAHAAAQAITDEKRRAEALLDIIKEIDYLSKSQQSNAS